VLLTGHPSAGKSTLAAATNLALGDRGVASEILDGDELRSRLPPKLGFSRTDRSCQFARALFVAEVLAAHGVVPILALVAPFRTDRELGVRLFSSTAWLEIFLDPPRRICLERDSRGLYADLTARGGRGLIDTEVFGLYEPPHRPALRLDTYRLGISEATAAILGMLEPFLPR
jgi:adenylylsulfate kinase